MTKQTKESRFSSLRSLREQRQNDENSNLEIPNSESSMLTTSQLTPSASASASISEPHISQSQTVEVPPQKVEPEASISKKRGPGRPRGRRSNPDYTQISAYIPLDLLLAVQDELASERRENRQRTARPVSDLVEELLDEWLKNRKSD